MSGFGDVHGSSRESSDASARLGRALDRAVAVARAARVLDLMGRLMAASTLAVVAIVLGRGLGLPMPFPAGPVAIAAAIGIVAWWASRRWRWPDRLSTAMDIERAHPWIGERISRAVGFIGDASERASERAGAPHDLLVREAAEEAAKVIESLSQDRSRLCSGVRDSLLALRWPAAGLAAAAAFVIATVAAPERFLQPLADAFAISTPREAVPRPTVVEPPSTMPEGAMAAAARLAEAAAMENRLAAALLGRFAVSPGSPREALPWVEQDWLDETATLQAAIADDIGRDLSTVVAAVHESDPQLAAVLAGGLVRERTAMLRAAAERIRGNQLAAASSLITRQTRPVLDSLRACGVTPQATSGPAFDRAGLVRRQIASAIEAGEGRFVDSTNAARSPPDRQDLVPADGTDREPVSSTLGESGSSSGTATGDATGSDAADTTPSKDGDGTIAAPGSGQLPAWVRAREPLPAETLLGDSLGVPARYRAAVSDYYRRLWNSESTSKGEQERTP